jgi:tripartite-type tricarboxylate transporter receptor subunit TctC
LSHNNSWINRITVTTIALVLAAPLNLQAEQYPARPLRIITVETGGAADFVSRMIAQRLSDAVGQQVVVENRAGAGGAIAAEAVARAQPDGYTMLVLGSTLWLLPFLRSSVPWDPVRDFSPITLATRSPNILVVHPTVTAGSVKELIALAKAKPGTLSYSSSGTGSSTHLAAALFMSLAGTNIVHVPYRGPGPALNALLGGEVQVAFVFSGSAAPHVKAGRLKALGVCSAKPSQLMPGLPPIAETLPGYELVSTLGVFAPAGTPLAIVSRLNQELVRILGRGEVKERFFTAGMETVGNSPQAFAALIKSDMSRLGKVIKDAGIRDD